MEDETGRRMSCDGKVTFDTPALAQKAATRRLKRMHYKCPYCRKWHVGNNTADVFKRPKPLRHWK